ncbi:MAG: hypothetical protein R3F07_12000 [Opitutaceae bacterium]
MPALASLLPVEAIRHISPCEENGRKVQVALDEVIAQVVSDLGIIPDKRAKVLLCVEGPHDLQFLKRINGILRQENEDVVDVFSDPRVAMVVLAAYLREWVNEHYLRNLNLPEVHIYDRDEEKAGKFKYQGAHDAVNARGDGSVSFLTGKREMENYLHLDAINEAMNAAVPAPFSSS